SRFAIAWSDARAFSRVDPTEGLQDLTVIDLDGDEPVSTRLSAGYRPSQVVVEESGKRAYVVSQPGITVLHLTHADGPRVERELFLPEEAGDQARDVSITPDGAFAFVRMAGESSVLIVDLASDERITVDLPAPVTDLDVRADGTKAVAHRRAASRHHRHGSRGLRDPRARRALRQRRPVAGWPLRPGVHERGGLTPARHRRPRDGRAP